MDEREHQRGESDGQTLNGDSYLLKHLKELKLGYRGHHTQTS